MAVGGVGPVNHLKRRAIGEEGKARKDEGGATEGGATNRPPITLCGLESPVAYICISTYNCTSDSRAFVWCECEIPGRTRFRGARPSSACRSLHPWEFTQAVFVGYLRKLSLQPCSLSFFVVPGRFLAAKYMEIVVLSVKIKVPRK